MKAARKLAAKKAAALPRWGNMRVGQMGKSDQQTTHDGLKEDPVSAVKIASIHGWEAAVSGFTSAEQAPLTAPQATGQAAVSAKSISDLVPGEDYPFIEITDGMAPDEKRNARIANSRARSAAVKALKALGSTAPVATGNETSMAAGGIVDPPVDAQPVVPAPASTGEPVAGVDYPVIELSDAMEPSEKRSARIANSRARSAAMKAYKAAGGSLGAASSPAPTPPPEEMPLEQAASSAESTPVVPTSVPSSISKPEYIAITDDMEPTEIREARINNSKAKSAYNKELKAAGIDPSTVAD